MLTSNTCFQVGNVAMTRVEPMKKVILLVAAWDVKIKNPDWKTVGHHGSMTNVEDHQGSFLLVRVAFSWVIISWNRKWSH